MRATTLPIRIMAALMALTLAMPAESQVEPSQPVTSDIAPDALQDEIGVEGVSAVEFITDREVYGNDGEDLGEVRDLLVDDEGRVIAVVVAVEGFLDIGTTLARIPLAAIEGGAIGGEPAILLPFDEDEIGDYSLFGDDTADPGLWPSITDRRVLPSDVGLWRISSRIGDPVRVVAGDGYAGFGFIDDFILADGRIAGIVVTPDASVGVGGRRIFPVDRAVGGGWNPRHGEVLLDITRDEALQAEMLPTGR